MSTIAVKKVKLGDNADLSKNFLIEVPAVADGTLTIKRENGTNVLSINATGKVVIPGVVGTVAQVGGVPTGQVVERGSNANGEYVRFADGTQICRGPHSHVPGSDRAVTFAAAFVAAPRCVGNVFVTNGADTLSCVTVRSITTTTAAICPRYENTSGTILIPPESGDYVAVGAWF